MKSSECLKPDAKPIVLKVSGLGPIAAFKNKKRAILDRHTGRMRTMTDAKTQKQMERIIAAIEWQLCCVIPTIAGETLTAQRALSWIASSLPSDDSRQNIPQIFITAVDCDKGEEGATITIERIPG